MGQAQIREAYNPMTDPRPFAPGEPFDAMAETFRTQVADMILQADEAAIFRGLSQVEQLQCIMSGTLTGLVGCCFAYIEPEGRDAIIEAIRDFVPMAAKNAESIIDQRRVQP